MRRLFLTIFAAVSAFAAFGAVTVPDTTRYAELDKLLQSYYVALAGEELSLKCDEMDYLIGTCRDSTIRSAVAGRIYQHYRNSPLMGEESVALHVYDTWYATGKVFFGTENESVDAMVFATFERRSMLYEPAPVITLADTAGGIVCLPDTGRLSVIFFYGTSCPKCKSVSILLPHVLEEATSPVTLYAVNTGTDEDEWKQFRTVFKVFNPLVKVENLWDPEVLSDYQMAYGVTGTPRLLAVSPDGTIIGRRLEIESLKQLLIYYDIYEQKTHDR